MRPAIAFAAALAIGAVIACGGDDSSTDTPSPTQATGTARTVTATPAGQKTGTPDQSTPSVQVTAPGETPSPPPVAPVGTPAVAVADEAAFLAQFAREDIAFQSCQYTITTGIADCGGTLYAIDPTFVGQDITCQLWVVDGTPRALGCGAVEPLDTHYYEIQE
jgi:hypothetical protein